MYSPTAYYLGRFLSNLLLQLLYPMIMIFCLFWILDINTDMTNFLWITAFGIMSNFVFCGQGFFLGTMILDESNVKLVNILFVMVFLATNGVLCNLNSANWFIKGLSKISPNRFNTEGFVRCVTMQIPDYTEYGLPISQEDVLEQFGYTWGFDYCIEGLIVWFFVWIFLTIIGINLKFKNLWDTI